MSGFWQKWLSVWCAGVVLFGLILALAAFAATDGLTRALFSMMAPEPFAGTQSLRFAVGLMGAVTMGWGGTFYIAFRALHALEPQKAAPLWRLITTALVAWYIIDSAISVATGFGLNAVSNTAFVALYLIPVLNSGVMRR